MQEQDKETRVLTDEERASFDGVTIDENGEELHTEDIARNRQQWQGQNPFGDGVKVKVFRWNSMSLLTRILIGIVIGTLLAVLFFFGGIVLTVIAAVAVVVGIISFIIRLFL